MADLVFLQTLVRGVAVGGFGVTGLALALDRRPTPLRWVGGLFFLCAVAHVIDSCQPGRTGHPDPLIWAASVATIGLFWPLAYALFADEQRFSPHRLWPAVGLVALWGLARALPEAICKPFWLLFNLASVGLVLHALLVIWRGWRGDLVNERRRLRGPVMIAAAGYILLLSAQDVAWVTGLPWFHAWGLPQALVLATLAVAGAVILLRPEPLLVEAGSTSGRIAPLAGGQALDLGPADRLVLARLETAMDVEEVWRGEDLSITALAALVGAPEHRLRRLINGVLGHRNFADYVNSRRIEAAKSALAAPDLALKSISTIAYDLGFASLGPFNRAFRAATGVTPSEWRATRTPAPTSVSARLRLVETADPASKADKSV
ncbi:AraC family transcriptional regulator [Caulobacter sp. Root1472]|uniref:helix-turn-helix domain-containing protein n=1 Tax=Caulobacter sp. Root1472 TaxID=1736470 RepID=UPI000702354F|nr:AraC family transcriptional regulator [Caulobacter sp. Root1472]KQZ33949.1 AraC family transcriptional regulator [Caulobacter sp. Root1472]